MSESPGRGHEKSQTCLGTRSPEETRWGSPPVRDGGNQSSRHAPSAGPMLGGAKPLRRHRSGFGVGDRDVNPEDE